MPQKSSDNTSIDAQIIPTIKDPQIDSAYINQFAKFILPYIQQDYERELSQKDIPKESNYLFTRKRSSSRIDYCSFIVRYFVYKSLIQKHNPNPFS